MSGERLEIPDHCPKLLRDVMNKCWKANPDERPDFLQILEDLEDEPVVQKSVELPEVRDNVDGEQPKHKETNYTNIV